MLTFPSTASKSDITCAALAVQSHLGFAFTSAPPQPQSVICNLIASPPQRRSKEPSPTVVGPLAGTGLVMETPYCWGVHEVCPMKRHPCLSKGSGAWL